MADKGLESLQHAARLAEVLIREGLLSQDASKMVVTLEFSAASGKVIQVTKMEVTEGD